MKNIFRQLHFLIPVLSLLLLFTINDYFSVLNLEPQSTHFWRQSDSYSISLNYYHDGMNFFKPELHNQHADNLESGYATSENPILYYSVAGLYYIFGPKHLVFRIFWLILFFIGISYFYKTLYYLSRNILLSTFLCILFSFSPLLMFYSSAFIPDIPALMFTIIGWHLFIKLSQQKQSGRLLFYSILFFTLSTLLKSPSFMSLIIIGALWILEISGFKLNKEKENIFPTIKRVIPIFLGSLIIIFAWYGYATYYDRIHETVYFSMRTYSIINYEAISLMSPHEVFRHVVSNWIPHIFSEFTFYYLGLVLLMSIVFIRKASKILLLSLAMLILGISMYFILWFGAFIDHDYYFIVTMILPAIILFINADLYRKLKLKGLIRVFYFTVLLLLVLLSTFYSIRKYNHRKYGYWNRETDMYYGIKEVKGILNQVGIENDDLVISIPDRTPNFTLSTLDLAGWTDFNSRCTNSEGIHSLIDKGASFLFIFDYEYTLSQRPFLSEFLNKPVAELFNTRIFRIDEKEVNQSYFYKYDTISSYNLKNEKIIGENLFSISHSFTSDTNNYKINHLTSNAEALKTSFYDLHEGDFVLMNGLVTNVGEDISMIMKNNSNTFYIDMPLLKNSDSVNFSKSFVYQDKWDIDTLYFYLNNPTENQFNVEELQIHILRHKGTK